ncbi:MAG: DNA mismatch repair endonuclease MutL [Bacteroidetes bacterium]|nr:DNA mismatch repair endonuclease MutL [Bacteroidota bacterium]MBS1976558.1 DNA mismatch repair endonuclease MutL [Bacteroidota bacterium]
MSDIIRLLPDSIANQIAAGEVVQRPASVVKELMENSIDAGATTIRVIIKEAGRTLIQVMDDGVGMTETDARLSLERHATSKIRTAEDLFTLRTMGFRGEALASIAAVSQMEMKTRPAEHELGTLLLVEGSEVKKQEPAACEKGTHISVKNLFYNIPARRNFLKSNPVEMRHIVDEFQRIALARPDLGLSLVHGDEILHDLKPSKLSQRIVALFGKSYQEQLAPCQEETELMKVSGYIGKPESARKTRGEQFIFVNQRFIRNNYLNHAVNQAYQNLLPEGNFPFYVLFLSIDPKHIDVNVHPTKTEIKFDDERAAYAVVHAAVRQALGAHNLSPALDYSNDVNLINRLSQQPALSREQYLDEQFGTSLQRSNLKEWEKLFEGAERSGSSLLSPDPQQLRMESAAGNQASPPSPVPKIVFQIQDRYLVRPVKNGLMIIDQQAAHERILFERFQSKLKGEKGTSIPSLFPQTIQLPPADFALLMEMEKEIRSLGFQFEVFGKNALLISGVPAEAAGRNEKELMEGLLEQFKQNQASLSIPLQDNLCRSLARRAAVKGGQVLSSEEMSAIVEGLHSCHNPNYSPDGSTTFFIFDTSKIESHFR